MTFKEYQHLYWRAGFGANPANEFWFKNNRKKTVDFLFKNSKTSTPLHIDTAFIENIDIKKLKNDPKKRRELQKQSREKIRAFNFKWIERLIYPKEILRERMTLFWANHFVCKDDNILFVKQFNNTLRTHALGDFRAFVKAISKEAAMLKYLNIKQNRKLKPNENFARELMELFTLGEGHYSEQDIKESARAFTGYNHEPVNGDFILRARHHDNGIKIFLGKSGNFNGDDIIDIILQEKQCAQFIASKVYTYFVNPKPNLEHINAMANVFYKDYNIENLMRFVFTSNWFYTKENIGAKIKSPVDYLVGMARTIPVTFERENDLIKIQKLLGQILLDPPNVAGWKGDKAWIDANTIMVRLKLASVLFNNALIDLNKTSETPNNLRAKYFKANKNKLPFKTTPNWTAFLKNFNTVKTENLHEYIVQGQLNNGTFSYLKSLNKASKQTYCIQLMSLPEYQMC
ncbi:hypothetical protein PW52_03000 [Tamlana sedimentorum]|uniref:Uncharacterized protein n=1 Tax=Neotamlana sedimentorum TaxID=1435349 RepID=A0A0D7WC26_9FLAO|nr:DUF1800 domain-containing protein [Tamlana sedimentorum]KJD36629.1 hypothetical protein PW52_03000 [Tamlana sedimentorum]